MDALVTQHLEEGHKLHLSTAELAEIILKIKNSQEGIVNELSVFHINEGLFSQEKTREADVGKLLLPCLISKLEDRIFEARWALAMSDIQVNQFIFKIKRTGITFPETKWLNKARKIG